MAGKECIDAQRAGQASPTRVVAPRFANELTRPLSPKAAREEGFVHSAVS